MLKYEDSNLGITAWGQILFDASKPIAANPDVQGWGTTQDFLFRLAGTTFPSAARDEDNGRVREWPYVKAQFQGNPNGKIDRGQYNVAWAVGITAQGLSLEHRGTASYDDFSTTPILPENTHPVIGWCTLGGRDANHCDSVQIFATKAIDSVHTIENSLYAYCDFVLDGQGGNLTGDKTYNHGYNDMAYINNVWSNIPIPNNTGLNFQPPSQRHLLWYQNTVHNLNLLNGLGMEIEKRGGEMSPNDAGVAGAGTNRIMTIKSGTEPYLTNFYGGTTFPLALEHDAIVYRNNFISKWSHEFDWIHRGLGLPYKDTYHQINGEDVDRQGISWPYINVDTTPLRTERNFRWDDGPLNGNANSQLDIMNVLRADNPPQFRSMIPWGGGTSIPAGMKSPYQLDILSHDLLDDSPLKGGGTLGVEIHVPFDMNRKRRIGHSTIGAYEVPSSYLTADDEYMPQTEKFNISEDLIPPIHGSTLISFSLDADTHENFYAKRIKIRATKEVDGAVEERFSDNILRFEQDITVHQGINDRISNAPALRSLFLDPPNEPFTESYLFISNNSAFNPYVRYIAPQDNEIFEPFAGSDSQQYEEDYQAPYTDASQNETWLKTSYDLSSIQIFGSNYQSVTGDQNKIRLSFDDGTTQGTTFATQFHTAYSAAGGTLAIAFPNGTTYFVDKAAGGMTAHGSSLESYFYTTTPGTTVSLTNNLPTGEVVIEKPTGL